MYPCLLKHQCSCVGTALQMLLVKPSSKTLVPVSSSSVTWHCAIVRRSPAVLRNDCPSIIYPMPCVLCWRPWGKATRSTSKDLAKTFSPRDSRPYSAPTKFSIQRVHILRASVGRTNKYITCLHISTSKYSKPRANSHPKWVQKTFSRATVFSNL